MHPRSARLHVLVVHRTIALETCSALPAHLVVIKVHFSVERRGKLQQLPVHGHVRAARVPNAQIINNVSAILRAPRVNLFTAVPPLTRLLRLVLILVQVAKIASALSKRFVISTRHVTISHHLKMHQVFYLTRWTHISVAVISLMHQRSVIYPVAQAVLQNVPYLRHALEIPHAVMAILSIVV